MSGSDESDRERRFETAWRTWATRPPNRSPRQAAVEVTQSIRAQGGRSGFWVPAAVVACLIAAVAISTWWVSNPVRFSRDFSTAPPFESATLPPGQVVFWLDENTPLYMNFQSPGDSGIGGGIR
jgi:ferric-dicitrate binding protein FerR (iron transport regulator)